MSSSSAVLIMPGFAAFAGTALYERRGWVLRLGLNKTFCGVIEVRYHRELP